MSSLYLILLTLHNLNRWLVLLFGAWTVIQSLSGLSGTRPFTAAERRPVPMFMGTLHLQVVLGLMLFAVMGMNRMPVFAGAPHPGFQWEHVGLGLLAAVFGTLASVQSRRAPSDQAKYRAVVLWAGLALLIMLMGMPWFRPLLRFFGA